MRIAIFSDVHGNADALQAVLDDIKKQGHFDQRIFAGDLVYGAHQPVECIQLIQENDFTCVYGNTDEFLWVKQQQDQHSSDEEWQDFLDYLEWLKDKIGDDGLSYLIQMPFEQLISPSDNKVDDLLVVHANPKDVQQVIFPSPEIQQEKAGRIIQSDEDVMPLIENTKSKTIAFGHIHMPNIRVIDNYKLFNISSVSRPQDGDWRAKYGILTFDNSEWNLEHRFVEYDIASTKQALLDSRMPNAEQFAASLKLP